MLGATESAFSSQLARIPIFPAILLLTDFKKKQKNG
jgi:hypothetical protein